LRLREKKMMNKVLRYISIGYLVAVVVGMVIPLGGCGVKMNDVFVLSFRGDYVLHCLVYLPWMWVGSWMFGKRFRWWWWLGLGVIVVAGMEGVQMGLDYRSFNLNDLVAGEVGVGGSGVAWGIGRRGGKGK
jgi:glycopeptide antibiotics resistance protein